MKIVFSEINFLKVTILVFFPKIKTFLGDQHFKSTFFPVFGTKQMCRSCVTDQQINFLKANFFYFYQNFDSN